MWRRPNPDDTEEAQLVDECARFLDGTYALTLMREEMPVPGWAWLNLLAHGSPALVAALAQAPMVDEARLGARWQAAASLLAVEMLTVAQRTGRSLGELQRSLVLRLEARPGPAQGRDLNADPANLVGAVRLVLGRIRRLSSS